MQSMTIRKVAHGMSLGILTTLLAANPADADSSISFGNLVVGLDGHGLIGTYKTDGPIEQRNNPFFQSLGTNGRSCSTCHVASQAMSFTPQYAQGVFARTKGSDPLFAFDGGNCPTVARQDRQGHSLILNQGLIRVTNPLPATAEFSISVVHDPYGCALQVDPSTGLTNVAVYRRPLPTANISFLSAVMWDGRETVSPLTSEAVFKDNLLADLKHQAMDATTGHAQAAQSPTDAQLNAIVDFELGVYSAQVWDDRAGLLNAWGATGGPFSLANQLYYPTINDSLGADPDGFTAVSMTMYTAWQNADQYRRHDDSAAARAEIAEGEKIFDTAPMQISNVRGLNDNAALKNPTTFSGNCATCHDTPNIGHHSMPLPLDIGTAHTANAGYETDPVVSAAVRELSMPDLPVFLITGCPNPFNAGQAESFYTTDPGKAVISGKCADFNRVKGPILRGLAARAPYFHNGSAANLTELVNFYNQRFSMSLTDKQKRALVAFLNSL